jgi:2-keto-3-deoxy-L-rhamnonate aldolase RhmA
VVEAMERTVEACRRHGKVAGNAAMDAAEVEVLLARGVRFIPISAAALFLISGAKRALMDCRTAVAAFTG